MKKKFIIISSLLLMVFMSGCSSEGESEESNVNTSFESQVSEVTPSTSPSDDVPSNGSELIGDIKSISIAFSGNILLTEAGDVYTWGMNTQGVLGLGKLELEAVDIPSKVEIGEPIATIEVHPSTNSVIAVSKSGNLYLFGGPNDHDIYSGIDEVINVEPMKIDADFNVKQASHSYRYFTAIDEMGNVYESGIDYDDPSSLNMLPDFGGVVSIANSGTFRSYLTSDGDVYISGNLSAINTELQFNEITKIDFTEKIIKIKVINYGLVALADSGVIYYVGDDTSGIAGVTYDHENIAVYTSPVQITKIDHKIVDMETSDGSIIVKSDKNEFYTWGLNMGSNVSSNTEQVITEPTRLHLPDNIKNFTIGQFSGAAITENNELYVWGSNAYLLYMSDITSGSFTPNFVSIIDESDFSIGVENSAVANSTEDQAASTKNEKELHEAESTGVLNPSISSSSSTEEEVDISMESTDMTSYMLVDAMVSYLNHTLTMDDHGGIAVCFEENEPYTEYACVWVVNKDNVNAAIQSYTGEKCELVLKDAKWTLSEMFKFSMLLREIPVIDGEKTETYVDERENIVFFDISATGRERLTEEAKELMKLHNIPDDYVVINITFPLSIPK